MPKAKSFIGVLAGVLLVCQFRSKKSAKAGVGEEGACAGRAACSAHRADGVALAGVESSPGRDVPPVGAISALAGLFGAGMLLSVLQIKAVTGRDGVVDVLLADGFAWWSSAIIGLLFAYPALGHVAAVVWYLLREPHGLKAWPDFAVILAWLSSSYVTAPSVILEAPTVFFFMAVFTVRSFQDHRVWLASIFCALSIVSLAGASADIEMGRAWAKIELCEVSGRQDVEVIPISRDPSGVVGWSPTQGGVISARNCRSTGRWVLATS